MAVSLLCYDWQMALAALWVLPITLVIVGFSKRAQNYFTRQILLAEEGQGEPPQLLRQPDAAGPGLQVSGEVGGIVLPKLREQDRQDVAGLSDLCKLEGRCSEMIERLMKRFAQDENAAGVLDGGQPVGNHNNGPALRKPFKGPLDQSLVLRVRKGCRFVQNQDGRIFWLAVPSRSAAST